MKLRCKPESENEGKQNENKDGGESECEGKRGNEGEKETQQAICEGEQEDDEEIEVKKLTEMSVEYEPLGVNR